MSNPLTGEFDVVAEFGVDAVNRILAAQHQQDGADQVYPHNIRTVIRSGIAPGVRGIAEIQISPPVVTFPVEAVNRVFLAAHAETIAPSLLTNRLDDAPTVVVAFPDVDRFFDGGTSRVTVHFEIRVRFRPDPGSADAPEFVHGDLRLTVAAKHKVSASTNILAIGLGDDELEISFVPNSGAPLSFAERNLIVRAARHIITSDVAAVNLRIDTPQASNGLAPHHWRFKTLPHATRPGVAVLISMRADHIPTRAHRDAYENNLLVGSDGFVVAIGNDFLVPTLEELLDEQISANVNNRSYSVSLLPGSNATYTVSSVGSPTVRLEQGFIEVKVTLRATTDHWLAPDAELILTMRLGLTATSGKVKLKQIGEPDLDIDFMGSVAAWLFDVLVPFFDGKVRQAAANAVSQAVNDAQPLLDSTLSGVTALTRRLRIPAPVLVYNAVAITRDGLTVHGDLAIQNWRAPVVSFDSRRLLTGSAQQLSTRLEYSALDSWIPGGSIRRYRWFLGNPTSLNATGVLHDHQFTMAPSPALRPTYLWSGWCLSIIGERDGREEVGSNCGVVGPDVLVVNGDIGAGAESGDSPLPVAVLGSNGKLFAHVDVSRQRPGRRPPPPEAANILLHFAGAHEESTRKLMHEVSTRLKLEERPLMVIAVRAPGTITARPLDERLGAANIHISQAEDYGDAWRKQFDVRTGMPAILVNPAKGVVWRSSASPSADELVEALDQTLVAARAPRGHSIRPGVREGDRAPNLLFDLVPGTPMKLSTLRGQPVTIVFVKTWSSPCLAELERLQQRTGHSGALLAVADGHDAETAAVFAEEHSLRFRIIADPQREVARRYGIVAWPTTVTIDERGLIHEVRTGASTVASENAEQAASGW